MQISSTANKHVMKTFRASLLNMSMKGSPDPTVVGALKNLGRWSQWESSRVRILTPESSMFELRGSEWVIRSW
ncbi:hypothetical protein FQN60_007156 [Etheostoma spectabile]|uniref:Uncharacterized protein n=1 Tax=Etheostoma spectabile TaxID=54343 RepID=A0A5J5CCS4_9PERO|nr:hypothetical protein FQN60_007156 [Etheostoma spectabile]